MATFHGAHRRLEEFNNVHESRQLPYYNVLGVSVDASRTDIVRAYRKLSLRFWVALKELKARLPSEGDAASDGDPLVTELKELGDHNRGNYIVSKRVSLGLS